MVFGHFRLFARHRESPSIRDQFLASVHLSGPEILIFNGNCPFQTVFQKPEVAILQFKMLSEVDVWLQCIITDQEIPILCGIFSFADVFPKPYVAILDFIMTFEDNSDRF